MAAGLRRALALALLAASPVRAQTPPDTLGATVETRLERERTRVRGVTTTRLRFGIGPWRVAAVGRYLADGFGRLSSDAFDWREDLALTASAWRPLRPGLDLMATSATVRIPQARVTRHESYAGLVFRSDADLSVTARAGVALDARPGAPLGRVVPTLRQDAGPALGLDVRYDEVRPEQAIRFDGQASGALLGARRAGDAFGHAVYRLDTPRLRVNADGRYRLTRRDAYNAVPFSGMPRPPAEVVEATVSDTLDARADADLPLATLPLAGPVRLAVSGALGRTTRRLRTPGAVTGALAFDTDLARQTLDADVALALDRPGLAARFGVRTGAAREARRLVNGASLPAVEAARKADLLLQTDFARSTLALVGAARMDRGRWFVLLDAERSILRFDTPDENPDDRDEALASGRAVVRYIANTSITLRTELVGSDQHTVYLRRARSAESQRQRTLRLRPGLDAVFGRVTRVSLDTEVRATYTRDDFTLVGRDRSDQSAREWRLESAFDQTFERGPLAGLRLEAEARLSDLRLGRLLPDRFAEVPFDTLRTLSLAAALAGGTRWRYRIGWRTFRRADAERALSVPFVRADGSAATVTRPGTSVFTQTGPVAALMLPLAGGSEVRVEGWYAVQRTRSALSGPLPAADANAIARAADGRVLLQPTVTVAARWRLR
ncbi:MAG: hypothetical protein IAE99_02265 [Rhodothermales bacterium]|nr:hypothetical protein [Rhodothermales bacterium]